MSNNEETKSFMSETEDSKKMLMFSLVFNIFIQIFASGGLQYMVSMINSLQMILHLPIFLINFPTNVMFFYQMLKPFVAFDILDNN